MTGRWVEVLPSADLAAGSLRAAFAGERKLLLARLDSGRVVASEPACPHQGADLTEGTLYFGAVSCPWHHYTYDLETGANVYPRNVFPRDLAAKLAPLRVFPAKDEGGAVWVEVGE